MQKPKKPKMRGRQMHGCTHLSRFALVSRVFPGRNAKKYTGYCIIACVPMWLRGKDLNQRPPGYEPDELPTALPRDISKGYINTAPAFRQGPGQKSFRRSRMVFAGACTARLSASGAGFPALTRNSAGKRRRKQRYCQRFSTFHSFVSHILSESRPLHSA